MRSGMKTIIGSGLAVALALTGTVQASDNPTVEEVNANPANFAGQTITFQKVSLYGNVQTSPVRFRFTVKSPAGTVYKVLPIDQSEQKLVFATSNKDEKAKKFVDSLSPEYYYTVNITVKIERMGGKARAEGRFWATLENIEQLTTFPGYKSK
jgi:hypothetical protein